MAQAFDRQGGAVNPRAVAARPSRAALSFVYEAMVDGVVVADVRARTIAVNAAMARLLGRPREEIDLRTLVAATHPDDRMQVRARLQHLGRGDAGEEPIEARLVQPDGTMVWVRAHVAGCCDDDGRPALLVGQVVDITAQRQAADELSGRALRDALTGLANRTLLLDRMRHALDRAERTGSVVAVLFCDLDHFKRVNDSYGHATGDAVLTEVAARLRAVVRPADTVARLGGDEFVVCGEDVGESAEAFALAERILAALRAPIAVDGRQLSVGTSVGIAIAGRGAGDPDEILRRADAAMYAAKGNGRNRYEVFDDGIRHRLQQRLDTERRFRHAVDAGELRLHLQPIFRIVGPDAPGVVTGFEALVRWDHPERGLLCPDDFLPVAEQSGTSLRILEWVLDAACEWARDRRDAGLAPPPVWINLSAAELASPHALTTIAAALAARDLPADALGFDVAEATVQDLDRTPGAGDVLEGISGLGCRLAIDDLGTAATSLRTVHRFGIQVMKLDPSLWTGTDPARLVRAAVAFAEALDLTVSAEGVETDAHLDLLRAAGCHWASGHLLAPPAPAEAVAALAG